MQFKGHLLLPDDTGPGLSVNLDVAAHHLAVESEGGGLGAWPLETVEVERRGDVFALTVAGESLQFVADDTIAFAYSAVPTIEQVSRRPRTRSAFRSMLDRIWNGQDESTPKTQPNPEPSTTAVDESAAAPTASPAPVADDIEELPAAQPATSTPVTDDIEEPTIDLAAASSVAEETDVSPVAPEMSPPGENLAGAPGCPAIRGDGRRCESPILTSSGYCYPHDPKRAFEDRYQAAQEARAQLKRDGTARLNRIYGRLDKAMRQVERGELDPETAMAMAQIARTMCAILDIEDPASEPSP